MLFNLFFFGKKDNLVEQYSLRQVPLLSTLSDAELANITKRLKHVEFKKGDIIFRNGDHANAFYIIISGRCTVTTQTVKKEERILAYLHKGDYFGEVALLNEKPHAADVIAKNDSLLLKLEKDDFFNLLQSIPTLSFQLSRRLGRRIKKLYDPGVVPVDAKIVSLVQLTDKAQKVDFSLDIAANVMNETASAVILINVMFSEDELNDYIIRMGDIPIVKINEISHYSTDEIKKYFFAHRTGVHILSIVELNKEGFDVKKLTNFLTDLLSLYKYVFINSFPSFHDNGLVFLEQSDLVYVVSETTIAHEKESQEILKQLHEEFKLSSVDMRLVLRETNDSAKIREKGDKLLGWEVFFVLPYGEVNDDHKLSLDHSMPYSFHYPQSKYARAVRFLARDIGGILVGLALGSGSAFGLAHIGVLKVLEDEKIDIDIIAGCSIGSVVGSLWASGMSAYEIERIALKFQKIRNLLQLINIFDICPPHFGICSGKTVKKFIRKYLGKKQFRDLARPLRIVATDLVTSEDVVFKDGSVVDAVRASISIPGIIRPVRSNNKFLIDGGVTNPLPISLLVDEGVKKIIAVNVLPTPRDILASCQYFEMQETKRRKELEERSRIGKFVYILKHKIRSYYTGNLVNVLMNTVQYLESAVSTMQQLNADIVIHPYVDGSHWAQFHTPEVFIENGVTETRKKIEEIRALVSN